MHRIWTDAEDQETSFLCHSERSEESSLLRVHLGVEFPASIAQLLSQNMR